MWIKINKKLTEQEIIDLCKILQVQPIDFHIFKLSNINQQG